MSAFAKSFSAKAKEFVPSFLMSSNAPEFTPYAANDISQYNQANPYSPYNTSQGMMAPAGNCMMISLDGYSDDSDDDSQPEKPIEEPTPKSQTSETPRSTCEPESERSHLESDDFEKESDNDGSPRVHAQYLSIPTLLQLRHTVPWLDGIDEELLAKECPELAQQQQPEEAPKPAARGGPARQQSGRSKKNPAGRALASRAPAPSGAQGAQHKPRSEKIRSESGEQWRAAPEELQVSDSSWLAKQMERRRTSQSTNGPEELSDEEVVRSMKSILNKLTVEKFVPLCEKLVSCGIRTAHHLEALITEVFDKATTQHHFISMYADLCELLHDYFVKHPISDDPRMTFKKLLLNGCQAFFERHLTPPCGLDKLDEEDRTTLELKYKMQMLGNIKFVGALLVRQMLAAKVMFAICDELISEPTPESLESLAALLTVVGPKFDNPEWTGHSMLVDVFIKVQAMSKEASLKCRVRFLLKDVLELRASKWQDRKVKKAEGPSTLKQVADTQAAEEAASGAAPKQQKKGPPSPSQRYSQQTGKTSSPPRNVAAFAADLFVRESKSAPSKEGYRRISSLSALKQGQATDRKEGDAGKQSKFDKDACRKEISGALAELRASHEVNEAILRICAVSVPTSLQAAEFCDMLCHIVEEGSSPARKICFELVATLFTGGHWKPHALCKGLQDFMHNVYPDLKQDVPTLPTIVREELHPALETLVGKGTSLHDALAGAC